MIESRAAKRTATPIVEEEEKLLADDEKPQDSGRLKSNIKKKQGNKLKT